jgi:glyoxylase-like metal-dependent hydrolase (beta-lactamase superfamily II)
MRLRKDLSIVGSGQFRLSSPYDCHVYAVRTRTGVVLIDAGSGLGEDAILRELGFDFPEQRVEAILLTHAHADHAAGAKSLAARVGCALVAGTQTREILEAGDETRNGLDRARKAGAYPDDLRMAPVTIAQGLRHHDVAEFGGVRFEAIPVRGHSDDSVCYLAALGHGLALFAGDVVFYGGLLGVINADDSGMQGYSTDLARLRNLKVELLLPSHGMFTLHDGQRHIDLALQSCESGFLPPQIGQGSKIF